MTPDHASIPNANRSISVRARRPLGVLAAAMASVPVWAEGGGKKGEEGAAVALLLLPLGLIVLTSLQVALLAAIPRFCARCGTAVRRYRWQTGLIGLGVGLGLLVLAALMAQIAQPLAAVPLVFGGLVGALGGAGVALEVGKWATARIDADSTPHPVVQLLVGGSLFGWGALLVPVAGPIAAIAAFFMAIGGVVYAVFRREALDEAPARKPLPTEPPATMAPLVPAHPAPSTLSRDDAAPSSVPGGAKRDDYGHQVF